MKMLGLFAAAAIAASGAMTAQDFPVRIEPVTMIPYLQGRVVVPPSPLKYQNIFVGGVDSVETEMGRTAAKQWHDYIGYAADATGSSLGYIIVNHEMIEANDKIGDGGGMTMFKLGKKADGTLEVLDQTLADGRKGKFFNVDFKNTVGETGMNCGTPRATPTSNRNEMRSSGTRRNRIPAPQLIHS